MFEFDLTFHNGPLATMKYTSTFSGNPFAGAGIELYNPNGSAGATLLSFEVTVEGDIFTIMDDNDYDTFPLVIIEDSIIDYIDFISGFPVGPEERFLEVGYQVLSSSVAYRAEGSQLISRGTVTDIRRVSVPEPGMLALLPLGLAILGFIRRRKET